MESNAAGSSSQEFRGILAKTTTKGSSTVTWSGDIDWCCLDAVMALAEGLQPHGSSRSARHHATAKSTGSSRDGNHSCPPSHPLHTSSYIRQRGGQPQSVPGQAALTMPPEFVCRLFVRCVNALGWTAERALIPVLRCLRRTWCQITQDESLQVRSACVFGLNKVDQMACCVFHVSGFRCLVMVRNKLTCMTAYCWLSHLACSGFFCSGNVMAV